MIETFLSKGRLSLILNVRETNKTLNARHKKIINTFINKNKKVLYIDEENTLNLNNELLIYSTPENIDNNKYDVIFINNITSYNVDVFNTFYKKILSNNATNKPVFFLTGKNKSYTSEWLSNKMTKPYNILVI